ncbi:MAG: SPFH domain-containing protein [Phycisphaerae bacterium]
MTGSTDRRGELVALLGVIACVIAAAVIALLATWSGSSIVWATGFQMAGVVGIWFLSWTQLHQRRLLAEERLEVAALEDQRREKLGGVQTIFDEEDIDQMDKLAMGRRLRSIERVLIPVVALIVAAYHVAAGVALLPVLWRFPLMADIVTIDDRATEAIFIVGGLAFACFMLSRYASGMSRLHDWTALRAGANYLFGSSLACFAAVVALVCGSTLQLKMVEPWATMAIGILMIVLAGETVINFVLDFYRPRIAGQRQRPFYDSRLLGMFSEPGSILHSLANAIDYQFGFKVSETWFYRLLGRALPKLLLLQVAVILALTSIVIVPPGHQAVIERYGRPRPDTAKPGLLLTLPWPIDQAVTIPVERVRRFEIGHARGEEEAARAAGAPILWTKRHFKTEYKLLVADRSASDTIKVPVNLLSLDIPVQWRVKSSDAAVIRFHRQSSDPATIIEALAYRALTHYAARLDILDLLGGRQLEIADTLKRNIQAACDRAGDDGRGLGIEILHVGIEGIHPPPDEEVALTYEKVVNAYEQREAKIKAAEGDAASTRTEAAGDQWLQLNDAIDAENAVRRGSRATGGSRSADLKSRIAEVERLLRTVAGGTSRQTVAEARKHTYVRVFSEQADAERYSVQLRAFHSAPTTYKLRVYLRMLAKGLARVRKYVIAMNHPENVLYEFDLKPPMGLDILGAETAALEAEGS